MAAAAITTYFAGQRAEFLATAAVSVVMVAVAILLARRPDGFGRGLAIMLAITAVIVVGAGVYLQWRDAGMVPALLDAAGSPAATHVTVITQEIERVQQVVANFAGARRAYAGLLALGAVAFALVKAPLWQGLGAGAAIMAVTGFVIDHYSQIRAEHYLQGLQ